MWPVDERLMAYKQFRGEKICFNFLAFVNVGKINFKIFVVWILFLLLKGKPKVGSLAKLGEALAEELQIKLKCLKLDFIFFSHLRRPSQK